MKSVNLLKRSPLNKSKEVTYKDASLNFKSTYPPAISCKANPIQAGGNSTQNESLQEGEGGPLSYWQNGCLGYKLKKSRCVGYSPIKAPWVVSVHDFSHVYWSLRGRQVKSSRIKSLKLVAICFLTCRGNSFSHFFVPSSCVEEVTNVLHFSEAIEMDSFFCYLVFHSSLMLCKFLPNLPTKRG